ncbi:serine-rich adhesin for platelets-like isoform X2 [Palaemon carinicauda]|uniref:serine-rich adhesin for platelets-like isoform X2 n=1 Tax=Palaemon carinicauda TaxID=392227 RepID=UPI0035B60E76
MERRESTIFYSDEEGDGAEPEKKADAAQDSKLSDSDLERYTTVAVRAKISVEVEQKKRLGAWGKRVLVLDGTTLYAYKTKGDGGSVGGWAIAGADVHVRRGNDSNREDGRHILVIARPPVYKLVFAFSTVYEQARMIQALSSSGATVTGLDAIMLLKNLRQQQEQEQKEEERRRVQNTPENSEDGSNEQSREELTNGEQPLEDKENETPELQDIDESIYDQGTGTVTNPLYASIDELNKEKNKRMDGASLPISRSINTSMTSDTRGLHLQGAPPNKDSEDKVNPVPKPPRASISEGSPISNFSVPDRDENERSVPKEGEEEASCQQSDFTGDSGQPQQQYLSTDVIPTLVVTSENNQYEDHSSQFTDKENLEESTLEETPNNSHASSDEDSEGEGFYEVNPDSPEKLDLHKTLTKTEGISDSIEDLENNYVELVSKMKLERGLSIESNSEGAVLEPESPERLRKLLGDSPLSDDFTKSPSPDNGSRDKENSSDDGYNERKYRNDGSNHSGVSEDVLSDNDERFEQLYQELSSSVNSGPQNNSHIYNETHGKDNNKLPNGSATQDTNTEENEESIEEEGIGHEVDSNEDDENTEGTSLKRVSSIIKKKGAPSTGKSKKVQFNLDATTIDNKAFDSPQSSESATKKKSDGGPTSPAKKKGIFSNIFSSASSKKYDVSATKEEAVNKKDLSPKKTNSISKKDISLTKVDLINKKEVPTKVEGSNKKDPPSPKLDKTISAKKTPSAPQGNLKRQPTVDLTAPLIISGSVEMGGSVGGKVSPRRIEVRDGHVLAFMPKASSPTSRLSLVGLSVTPLMGGSHPNALSLARANRCMMVIKLSTREEMMRWINVLSDEVIKLTPENQRTGLILYPSPKNKVATNQRGENGEENDTSHENDNTKMEHKIVNGHKDDQSFKTNAKKTLLEKDNQSATKEVTANGDATIEDEDTGDGWIKKKKQAVVEEFEMGELKKREQYGSASSHGSMKPSEQPQPLDNLKADHFKEEKESEKTRKINKLNIQEIWKEQKDTENETQIMNNPNRRQSLEYRQHPPLRRLSGQDHLLRRKTDGSDLIGNLPSVNKSPKRDSLVSNSSKRDSLVNNSPKRDYHANCHPPLERLSNRCRILSASESNLRKSYDQRSQSTQSLHRFGSELTLQENTKKETNTNLKNSLSDTSNVLVSSRIIRNQSINKGSYQKGSSNGMSPASSPSLNCHKKSLLYEPREVEIIESEKTGSQELLKEPWYEDGKPTKQHSEPPQEDLPGITWSVAATREKFELLCSVSGENKSGKLTTKTPISRKKSIKKRRSTEGGSGRRQNARWSARSPSQETNSNDSSNSSPAQHIQTTSVSDRTTGNKNTSPSTSKAQDFKLPPVRDLRRNFEKDITDSSDSFITNSSLDSLTDINSYNYTNNYAIATKEPSSPLKSPLKRTQNILHATNSPCSSPEPEFITSKLINSRPRSNIPEEDKGIVSRSLMNQMNAEKDSEVVICWRGPYIAQDSDSGQNTDQSEENPKKDRKERKEAEQAVLSNISNAFLAKRRLLAREVAAARIQEKLSALEETIWDIQASMAELDKQTSTLNVKVAGANQGESSAATSTSSCSKIFHTSFGSTGDRRMLSHWQFTQFNMSNEQLENLGEVSPCGRRGLRVLDVAPYPDPERG